MPIATCFEPKTATKSIHKGEQLLFDAEDEGRAAAGKLQRWGLEAQEKWGDGDWEKDRRLFGHI